MVKNILRFGIIAGLIQIVYITGLDRSKLLYTSTGGAYLGYLAILILPICLFFLFMQMQKEGRKLSVLKAALSGTSAALVTACIYNLYMFIDITFFESSHLKNQVEYTVRSMRQTGMNEEKIALYVKELNAHYHSAKPYISTFIWYVLLGLGFSLLLSIYFKIRFKIKSK